MAAIRDRTLSALARRWHVFHLLTACFVAVTWLPTLAAAPSPDGPARFGVTPLMLAAYQGDVNAVKAFLAKGVDINAKDVLGETALVMAVQTKDEPAPMERQVSLVRLLLDAGADVNAGGITGDTALHEAVIGDRRPLVQLLLEKGAHVNARGIYGYTPLMRAACWSRNETVVKALLSKGAMVREMQIPGQLQQ